jgi:Flp pilus assembly protein TadG
MLAMRKHKTSFSDSRSGIAATELAVCLPACLPILVLLIMGTIDACSMIYLKQTHSVAAYEGARASLRHNAVTSDVSDACKQILTPRNVNAATISVTPSDFDTQPVQTWITVTVSASGGSNSIMPGWFYDTVVVTGTATMMKEY